MALASLWRCVFVHASAIDSFAAVAGAQCGFEDSNGDLAEPMLPPRQDAGGFMQKLEPTGHVIAMGLRAEEPTGQV